MSSVTTAGIYAALIALFPMKSPSEFRQLIERLQSEFGCEVKVIGGGQMATPPTTFRELS